MPVQNRWLVENRVLLTELSGTVTAQDLLEAAQVGTDMIESGTAPVYSLVDLTQLDKFPMRLGELGDLFASWTSDNLGWIVIYGIPNRLVNFLATTFSQIIRKHYKVVNTYEEAMRFVEERNGQPMSPNR